MTTTDADAGNNKQAMPAWIGLGRAIGGAIVFSLPLTMTMEMWWIGFYIDPLKLMVLILVSLPLFTGISSMIGFEDTGSWWDDALDVLVAYAVAFLTTGIALLAFGAITLDTASGAAFKMVLLQAVPASLGALLARSLIGSDANKRKDQQQSYGEELIILITGALFLAFNLAPTEEMVLISYMMTPWHMMGLLALTLAVMHMFTLSSSHCDFSELRQWRTHLRLFVRFTTTGYVLALFVSIFMLWVFGRVDHEQLATVYNTALVLSFPAGIGAAASRLIV